MSKRSRGFQPSSSGASGSRPSSAASDPATDAGGTAASADPSGGGTAPTTPVHASTVPTSRSASRRRAVTASRPAAPTSFLERYRGLLLVGFAVVGVAIVAGIFMQSASAAPYTCDSLLTPGPTDPVPTLRPATPSPATSAAPAPTLTLAPGASPAPTAGPAASSPAPTASPAASASPSAAPSASASPSAAPGASASPSAAPTPEPQPTQRLGFATTDLGRNHVDPSTSVRYGFCPPTSGNHFNVAGQAPLARRLYRPTDSLRPGNWIHNLEHGYVVIAYKGDPGKDVLDQIQTIMDTVPPSDFAAANCGADNKVIAVRFDDMSEPFAVLAWDRALLLPTFDAHQIATFAQQWQDSPQHPEPIC